MQVSGIAKNIQLLNNTSNTDVKVSYISNGKSVAPFVIEKTYHNGKIIFFNAGGYFKTLLQHYIEFSTLGKMTGLFGLTPDSFKTTITSNAIPTPRFVGGMNISGHVIIDSSSFLSASDQYLLAEKIVVNGACQHHHCLTPTLNYTFQ